MTRSRRGHRAALAADILAAIRSGRGAGVGIYTVADIAADPHYEARDMIRRDHDCLTALDGGARHRSEAAETPGEYDGGGPALGEHTDAVLRSLGYDAEAIADLRLRRRDLTATQGRGHPAGRPESRSSEDARLTVPGIAARATDARTSLRRSQLASAGARSSRRARSRPRADPRAQPERPM